MNEELNLEKLADLAVHYPEYLIDAAAEHFNGDECKLEAIAVVVSGLNELYMPTKALVNIQGSFPTGSTLQVWICNNGNDAEPTWEDITTKALTSQKHFFTNQTKTAASWGVKIKVKLLRGSAEGDCYIQSVGGNFA